MNILKFILRLLGWLVTILLQIALSFLIIFIFSVMFSGADSTSRLGWLALIFVIWLSYIVGINLVGWAALRWVWREIQPLVRERLLATAIGAAIPLLILLPIGFSVPVGAEGTRFYDLVTNNWQPILAQASLFAAIVGYYAPGIFHMFTRNR
jgi:hypothetical protein